MIINIPLKEVLEDMIEKSRVEDAKRPRHGFKKLKYYGLNQDFIKPMSK